MMGAPYIFASIYVFSVIFCALLAFAMLAFVIWMLIDCLNRDEKDFKDRTLWVVLLTIGLFLGYGAILSIVYYFTVKKKLDR